MTLARARTQTIQSATKHTNHETNAPPLHCHLMINKCWYIIKWSLFFVHKYSLHNHSLVSHWVELKNLPKGWSKVWWPLTPSSQTKGQFFTFTGLPPTVVNPLLSETSLQWLLCPYEWFMNLLSFIPSAVTITTWEGTGYKLKQLFSSVIVTWEWWTCENYRKSDCFTQQNLWQLVQAFEMLGKISNLLYQNIS